MPRLSRPRLPSLLLAALLAALTCDDSRRNEPLAAQVSRAFCAHRLTCCSPFELAAVTSAATPPRRIASPTRPCRRASSSARRRRDRSGPHQRRRARADACLKAFRDRSCSARDHSRGRISRPSPLPNVAELLASCPDMLVGHVPDNRACNLSEECLRGSRCVSGTPSTIPAKPRQPASGQHRRNGDRHAGRLRALPAGRRALQPVERLRYLASPAARRSSSADRDRSRASRAPWSSTC